MNNKIVGVRFKRTGKLCYFEAYDYSFKLNDNVIATIDKEEELGRIVKLINKEDILENIEINKDIRPANKKDLEIIKNNENKAEEVLKFCKEEAKKLKLSMKFLIAKYNFDLSKLTIYFVAEERVDFRELVKILASKYKTRIELRQIGPRDEVKSYPNLGMCGKEVCCRTFLQDFEPVTIKMAKNQGLQINMPKLSGACGKLMCCLKYEEEAYQKNLKKLPKIGEIIKIKDTNEEGKVVSTNILGLKVKVKFGEDKEDERFEIYDLDQIKWNKKRNKE